MFSALTKICKLIDEHPDAEFILWNGSGVQIKHRLFEKYVDEYLNAK
ncbi:excisionase [Eisenbergiella massiliensis]